jgi:hypothetical protein
VQRCWPGRPIWIQSKRSHAPERTPVESLEIQPDRITLTLNIGLRSSTSTLPSYFRELEIDPKRGPAFDGLIGRIDDGLLRARLEATDAGSSAWLGQGGPETHRGMRAIARLATPSGLFWLFSRVFPELRTSVRRGIVGVTLTADEARLGFAMLGSAMLGGSAPAPIGGFDVALQISRTDTWTDEDWPTEIVRRLDHRVWPALRGAECLLRVWLVDPRGGAMLRLGGGRVGVEPLVLAPRPGVSLLFEGPVPQSTAPGAP